MIILLNYGDRFIFFIQPRNGFLYWSYEQFYRTIFSTKIERNKHCWRIRFLIIFRVVIANLDTQSILCLLLPITVGRCEEYRPGKGIKGNYGEHIFDVVDLGLVRRDSLFTNISTNRHIVVLLCFIIKND